MNTSEKHIERRLCTAVKKLHGLSIKFTSPGMQGVPDRIVIIPLRKIFFVELKASVGVLSPMQIAVHKLFAILGFPVHVLSTEEEVDEFIADIKLL